MNEIIIEGITLAGSRVLSFTLAHGADPAGELARRGWNMTGPIHAYARPGAAEVVIQVRVVEEVGDPATQPHVTWMPSTNPVGEVPPGVQPKVTQRLAAYAVVVRDGEALLTSLSAGVRGAAGRWTLPGGGLDPAEDPSIGVRREVWEETGQHLGEIHLIDLVTSHWTGQAPDGTWEDYQVVRLIYAATVPEPGPLEVHDIGGTTASAAWRDPRGLSEDERGILLIGARWDIWRAIAEGRRHR